MKSSAKGNTVLGCIDVDIRVGGSCHRQFVNRHFFFVVDFPAKCALFLGAYGSTGDSL
jgi:hypothetical protein